VKSEEIFFFQNQSGREADLLPSFLAVHKSPFLTFRISFDQVTEKNTNKNIQIFFLKTNIFIF